MNTSNETIPVTIMKAATAVDAWRNSVGFNEVECERSEVREAISASFQCLQTFIKDISEIQSLALRVKHGTANVDELLDFIDGVSFNNNMKGYNYGCDN